ncbi:MAG TPA: sigma-70 family RNA polymerase sigma factor [Candidatus Polarisedimenticolaceae bacterium]|nr:sigma-70 family RNA polymerase sigma factor [Candidatus Polarisedimenticolaceae bacterium]
MSTPLLEARPAPRRALWPARIVQLGGLSRGAADRTERERARAELWVLVNAALVRYTRLHARRYDGLGEEDLLELASSKALDLLRKLDEGIWDPTAATPAQLCALLSTLARNGLVDLLRTRPRFVVFRAEPSRPADSPLLVEERRQFTHALCRCLERLTPRARRIWLLRACLELSSREIAHHPGVRASVATVDVMLLRCRQRIRGCLREKGYEPRDMPRGTFATLWDAVSAELDATSRR